MPTPLRPEEEAAIRQELLDVLEPLLAAGHSEHVIAKLCQDALEVAYQIKRLQSRAKPRKPTGQFWTKPYKQPLALK